MTLIEAIQSNPILANVPEGYINTLLVSRSIDGAADYSKSSLKDLQIVTADIYVAIATLPEFSEGELSIKYDTEVLLGNANRIYDLYKDPNNIGFGTSKINVKVLDVE